MKVRTEMAFQKDDRLKSQRKLVFGNELELPKGSKGTVVGAGPIRASVDFDDDNPATIIESTMVTSPRSPESLFSNHCMGSGP